MQHPENYISTATMGDNWLANEREADARAGRSEWDPFVNFAANIHNEVILDVIEVIRGENDPRVQLIRAIGLMNYMVFNVREVMPPHLIGSDLAIADAIIRRVIVRKADQDEENPS